MSAMTMLVDRISERVHATLWQTVDEPTPPLAPTKASTWPTGSDAGLLYRLERHSISSNVETGATRYSEMPRFMRSR